MPAPVGAVPQPTEATGQGGGPPPPSASGHQIRRVLPLGAGMLLVGLGLGFLGLRLRRG
ncbi:hypothetical protein [Actinacidiphila yeochonensis]|uniref:hypothetical protein n=1 Tax=Actinacidiphila yeochonensis TaxID=89050 RepID=UPI000B2A8124|nr:hypothetical protein [Actinacidiphila yeochonensis]